jgi:hypothetical protein
MFKGITIVIFTKEAKDFDKKEASPDLRFPNTIWIADDNANGEGVSPDGMEFTSNQHRKQICHLYLRSTYGNA